MLPNNNNKKNCVKRQPWHWLIWRWQWWAVTMTPCPILLICCHYKFNFTTLKNTLYWRQTGLKMKFESIAFIKGILASEIFLWNDTESLTWRQIRVKSLSDVTGDCSSFENMNFSGRWLHSLLSCCCCLLSGFSLHILNMFYDQIPEELFYVHMINIICKTLAC